MSEKILFTDLDGTLLSSQKTVSAALREGLARFTQSGGRLVLSTGRMLISALTAASENGILFPGLIVIAFNGSVIYDVQNRRYLLKKSVPSPIASQIVAFARSLGLYIQSYTDTHVVCEKETPELLQYLHQTKTCALFSPDIIGSLKEPTNKLLAIDLNGKEKLLLLQDQIQKRFGDTISALFSSDEYLEIFDKTAGKGNALRYLCAHLQIPLKASVAVGDAPNDLSMLHAAGFSIAMANAGEAVKKQVDLVTQNDNDHDGVLEVLERCFLES